MPHVIKREQPVKEHQVAVGNLQVVFGDDRELFYLADCVVGKESDSACGKWRQSGQVRWSMLAQKAVQNLEYVAFLLRLFAVALDCDLAAARAQDHIRSCAQKGVSANFFAAFNRLQQK